LEISLRDYQQKDLDEILFNIEIDGIEKQILHANVSYGKGVLLAKLCKDFYGKIIISLPFSDLVEQIEDVLSKIGVEYSVIRSGQPEKFNKDSRIQIALDSSYHAKKDTLYKDLSCELIILDEIHVRLEGGRMKSMLYSTQPSYIVGLSGTPFKASGVSFDGFSIVNNVTHRELIEKGYVANVETYVSNLFEINGIERKVTVSESEYSEADLSVMYTAKSIDTMIDSFEKLCHIKNLEPKTTKALWFVTNVESCEKISNALIARGYMSFAYHGKTKFSNEIMDSYRNNSILKRDVTLFNYKDIESVKVKHLVSVNKLTTGFSVDDIQVGILTAATQRLPTFCQRNGRLSRKNGDMPKYIIDFGGSSITFGDFQEHFVPIKPGTPPVEIREYMLNRGLTNPSFLFYKDNLVLSSQSVIDENIKVFNDSIAGKRLGELRIGQLLDKWSIEDNIDELILIFFAFIKNAYCEDMEDKWGRATIGYSYQKYDRDSDSYSTKLVTGFYNEKTATWLLELYYQAIDRFPEKEKHWFKAMKTKMFNMARMKQWLHLKNGVVSEDDFESNYRSISENIFSIRFFPDFLVKKFEEEKEDESIIAYKDTDNDTSLEPSDESVSFKQPIPEIDIDEEEMPF